MNSRKWLFKKVISFDIAFLCVTFTHPEIPICWGQYVYILKKYFWIFSLLHNFIQQDSFLVWSFPTEFPKAFFLRILHNNSFFLPTFFVVLQYPKGYKTSSFTPPTWFQSLLTYQKGFLSCLLTEESEENWISSLLGTLRVPDTPLVLSVYLTLLLSLFFALVQ